MKKQDAYDKWRGFFKSKQRPLHLEQRLGLEQHLGTDAVNERGPERGEYCKDTETAAAKLFSSSSSDDSSANGGVTTNVERDIDGVLWASAAEWSEERDSDGVLWAPGSGSSKR